MPRKWRRTGGDALHGCPALLPCVAVQPSCSAGCPAWLPCVAVWPSCPAGCPTLLPCSVALHGCPTRLPAAGPGPATALRRHFISVACTRAWAWSYSLNGTSFADLGEAHTLSSVCISFLLLCQGLWGQKYLQKGAPNPQKMLPGEPAACSPASGVAWALSSTMSAVHSDSLILSHCQESPRQPAGSRGTQRAGLAALPLWEAPLHPLQQGEVPTEGIGKL